MTRNHRVARGRFGLDARNLLSAALESSTDVHADHSVRVAKEIDGKATEHASPTGTECHLGTGAGSWGGTAIPLCAVSNSLKFGNGRVLTEGRLARDNDVERRKDPHGTLNR